jgi:hypothetical protein
MKADDKVVLVGFVTPPKAVPPLHSAVVVPEYLQLRLLVLQAKNIRTSMDLVFFSLDPEKQSWGLEEKRRESPVQYIHAYSYLSYRIASRRGSLS